MRSIQTNKELIFYVFIIFLIINFISSGGHTDLWDGMITFLITEGMVLKQTAQLDPEIPSISNTSIPIMINTFLHWEVQNNKVVTGKYYEWVSMSRPIEPVYTSRALFLPAISVPFYFLATLLSVNPVSLIAFSVNSIIIALTGLVIFCFSLDLYGSRRLAFLVGLIFTACTFILPYNNSLFPQPLQALCIVSGVFFLYKARHNRPSFICVFTRNIDTAHAKTAYFYCGLAGLFFGLSIFASPTSGLFLPGFVICSFIFLRHNKRLILCFLLTLGALLILAGILNYVRFGSISEFGYGSQYGNLSLNTGWIGLLGLLLSPGKGLLFYFPPIVLLPLAILFSYRQNKGLSFITVYVLGVAWLYFGTIDINGGSRFWSGAIAWGPRYLIPTLPLIVIMLGGLIKYPRKHNTKRLINVSLISTCVAGFIVNLGGVLVWTEYGLIYGFENEKLGGGAEEITTWDPKYSPIVLHMKMLSEDYVAGIPVQDYKNTGWGYATYGLSPCQYDLYILCKFGIVPMVILSGAAILLVTIILKRDKNKIRVYS
jgi:hypothetical protein